ncbi:hypothetical protein GCM10011348_33930 [Marinobacterium nitratireducens]|uniref:DUF1468 domain-containing protein n=1 Tax=Marinobacterium nitratireducens TaxID=518897 RepID=A0A917ZK92_9GAMM|nr:tripartite tricarboxylate transporter TctB family protein [Marinobacterium nitratireducens]GGO85426.1 hypothetical protein GCM10011348_33930 [Marinobacterium nitratireducens]
MVQIHSLRAVFTGFISLVACLLMFNSDKVVSLQSTETDLYRSPVFFPTLALAIIAVTGIALVIQAFKKVPFMLDMDCEDSSPKLFISASLLFLFLFYSLSSNWIGYLFSTLLFLMTAFFLSGIRSKVNIVLSALISLSLYAIFVWLLDIWFPKPWLASLLANSN